MTDLASHLERLGLEQYLDAFVGEGFDTWETVLDVSLLQIRNGLPRALRNIVADSGWRFPPSISVQLLTKPKAQESDLLSSFSPASQQILT